jgi:hypothetical protein
MFKRSFFGIGLLAWLAGADAAGAQAFTHADSGWVRIFNGVDFTGIYSRAYNAPVMHPVDASSYSILYPGTDTACIYVLPTAKLGNIGTDKTTYSHYRVRVEQRFDQLGPNNNAGLTYHTDETVGRMGGNSLTTGNWPRSIEFQMQQREPGAAYSIQQCTFDTRVNGGNYAHTGGNAVTVCEFGCNARNYGPSPTIPEGANGSPRWLRFELVTRGSDTAWHYINDTLVFKLWNIRIFNDNANKTPNGPYNHGAFGLQSEGSAIKYRRWEVMEFPAGTPMNANYLHRIFVDHPDSGETLAPGQPFQIKWRTIGAEDIPNVSIEYSTGTGGWQSIAASAPNNGSYSWNVPNTPTSNLRVRISGPAWAWADSSRAANSIGPVSITRSPVSGRAIAFIVDGEGTLFSDLRPFSQVEIVDVFGRLIRRFPVEENKDLRWDLSGAQGRRVLPGLYFIRAKGVAGERMAKILVK